jgi:Ribonuclease G/E
MDSAERRTDEEDEHTTESLERSPADFSDEDLSFSRPEPAAVPPTPPPAPKSEEREVGSQRFATMATEEVASSQASGQSVTGAPTAPEAATLELPATLPVDPHAPAPPELPEAEPHEFGAEDEEDLDERVEGVSDRDFDEEDEDYPEPPRRRGRDDRRGRRPGGHRGPMGRPGSGRPKPLIQDIFRRGQEVLVQVIKEGIGTKARP